MDNCQNQFPSDPSRKLLQNTKWTLHCLDHILLYFPENSSVCDFMFNDFRFYFVPQDFEDSATDLERCFCYFEFSLVSLLICYFRDVLSEFCSEKIYLEKCYHICRFLKSPTLNMDRKNQIQSSKKKTCDRLILLVGTILKLPAENSAESDLTEIRVFISVRIVMPCGFCWCQVWC